VFFELAGQLGGPGQHAASSGLRLSPFILPAIAHVPGV
jgi:hypothetical protein